MDKINKMENGTQQIEDNGQENSMNQQPNSPQVSPSLSRNQTESLESQAMHQLVTEEFLQNIEKNAQTCAKSVEYLTQTLKSSLNTITNLSVQYMETYQLSINNVCDAANTSVIDTTNLISKLQELNQDLKQIEPLHIEIKSIKKNLDLFELYIAKLPK